MGKSSRFAASTITKIRRAISRRQTGIREYEEFVYDASENLTYDDRGLLAVAGRSSVSHGIRSDAAKGAHPQRYSQVPGGPSRQPGDLPDLCSESERSKRQRG